ncbi:MAG: amidohydrolase family protein [Methylococcaceae bacterium]|nr:amidohydrolase family protein [Methylococcaceae bacterium]
MIKKTSLLNSVLFLALSAFNTSQAIADETKTNAILLHAARVFDGNELKTNTSVLISDGKVTKIDARESFNDIEAKVIDLGDATLLPGFIELHAHLTYKAIPAKTVLKHGVTTLRDLGGIVHQPYGGKGNLRVLTSGKIITAVNGYPIPNMGAENIAIPVDTAEQARETVRKLINEGAVIIKIALETGGEQGAPWSSAHHGHHKATNNPHAAHDSKPNPHHPAKDEKVAHHKTDNPHHSEHKPATHHATEQAAWPLLSEEIVKAIVDEAHKHQRKVTAHIGEQQGAEIAVNAGVDEWAHIPCAKVSDDVLQKAVAQKIKIIGTFDTLSKCSGIAHNAQTLAKLGAEFLYGSEIAHPDIPWGIDAQELMYMVQLANMQPLEVLRAATSKAGEQLAIPLLGTLQAEAPADIIAVKGNPLHALKTLEYPDLVISGGKVVVNNFED